jgi:hypothetical protein
MMTLSEVEWGRSPAFVLAVAFAFLLSSFAEGEGPAVVFALR